MTEADFVTVANEKGFPAETARLFYREFYLGREGERSREEWELTYALVAAQAEQQHILQSILNNSFAEEKPKKSGFFGKLFGR